MLSKLTNVGYSDIDRFYNFFLKNSNQTSCNKSKFLEKKQRITKYFCLHTYIYI